MRYWRFFRALSSKRNLVTAGTTLSIGSGLTVVAPTPLFPTVLCDAPPPSLSTHENFGVRLSHLPTFSSEEIAQHNKMGESVWVIFRDGVYDITEFVHKHPGGAQKIMLGAGKSIEPFWRLYGQHLSLPHISHMLEEMRIGNLAETDRLKEAADDALTNPYRIDHQIDRHPGLVFVSKEPANAETSPDLLVDSFLTPNELFFVRHHFPVPDPKDKAANELVITVDKALGNRPHDVSPVVIMSPENLRKDFPQHTVVATIQCTGNRRTGFKGVQNAPGDVKGLPWTIGAISNAKWSGPKLRDVIVKFFGGSIENIPKHIKHVHLTGRDNDGNGQYYAVSIPIERALDERSDVILALDMNDEPLPLDHGAPIRVVVPGAAGCRSVKWLHKIELSSKESDAFWQKEDYKSFSPSQGWTGLDFNSAPSVMSTPVQSAICSVTIRSSDDGQHTGSKYAVLKGYAFSGGGNAIIRVDVSADGGKTWTNASIEGEHEEVANGHLPYRRTYSWSLWEAVIDLPEGISEPYEFVVKAVDENYNSQPEKPDGIWNVRGILNNSWHRVTSS